MPSVLVSTCDSYHDVLDLFISAYADNWPNTNLPLYINGELKPYISKKSNIIVNNILSTEKIWGARFLSSLNSLKDEFVITLLDDYILESKINEQKFNDALLFLEMNKDISCIYLHYLDSFDMKPFSGHSYNEVIPKSLYRINTLPAIWRRNDLIKVIEKKDDPWTWEAFSMYRKQAKFLKILSVSSSKNNIYEYSAKTGGAVYRGKWVKEVVSSKFIKYNLATENHIRLFLDHDEKIKRTFLWKLKFLYKGFQIARFKVFVFIFRSLMSKWK